jgi:hypothetical protein
MDVVEMARQILDMHNELNELRAENAILREYEAKYHAEVREGVKHGEKMMVNLMDLCLTPGVIDACKARASSTMKRCDATTTGILRHDI